MTILDEPLVGQRATSFRFDLLDQTNSYLGPLDVDMTSPPRISNNINRDVKRQMSGLRLPPSVTAAVNTLSERIRPWVVFEDRSEFPCGVFLFADASRSLQLYGSSEFATVGVGSVTNASCLDLGATLNQGSRGINFYRVGASIRDAIEQQLAAGGISDYNIDASTATVASPVVWKPNTKRLKVINDLCAMAGYYSLYFDNNGIAQARLVPNLDAVDPTFTYDVGNVFADTILESDDVLDAPNTYVVVNSAFTDFPVWGEWQVPSSSPNSYANRGFWVVREYDIQGIESNDAAARAAKAKGQADYSTYRWANFSVPIDPRHDTFDITSWSGDKYREQSWEFSLAPDADMKLEMRRVYVADDTLDFPPAA